MKKPILYVVLLLSTNFLFAQGSITFNPDVPSVTNGIVDFSFDLAGGGAEYDLSVEVSFDGGTDWNDIDPLDIITGQLENVEPATGIELQWDAMASFPGQMTSNALLRVTARHVCETNFSFTYAGETVTYGTILKTYNEGTVDEFTLCWFDRNLGAEDITTFNLEDATGNTDTRLYGDLFQWGRGDDGHQDRGSDNYDGDQDGLASTFEPNTGEDWDGKFITLGSPGDWLSSQNNTLWQGEDGINNPCPSGWRVPIDDELEAERLSWHPDNNSTGAFNSDLKWPVGGRRSYDGTLYYVGSNGFVWSSSVSGTSAKYLRFLGGGAGAGVGSLDNAYGLSVRCVRDN